MSDQSYDRLRDDYLQARKEAHDTSLTMNKFMLLICAGTGSLFITIASHSERLLVVGASASFLCLVAVALYYWAMCESLRVSLADQLVNRIRMDDDTLLHKDTTLEHNAVGVIAKYLGYKEKIFNKDNYESFLLRKLKRAMLLTYWAMGFYIVGILGFCASLAITRS